MPPSLFSSNDTFDDLFYASMLSFFVSTRARFSSSSASSFLSRLSSQPSRFRKRDHIYTTNRQTIEVTTSKRLDQRIPSSALSLSLPSSVLNPPPLELLLLLPTNPKIGDQLPLQESQDLGKSFVVEVAAKSLLPPKPNQSQNESESARVASNEGRRKERKESELTI